MSTGDDPHGADVPAGRADESGAADVRGPLLGRMRLSARRPAVSRRSAGRAGVGDAGRSMRRMRQARGLPSSARSDAKPPSTAQTPRSAFPSAATGRKGRSTRPSISAPTTAACWSPRRAITASASSTRFRGSSGWARGSAARPPRRGGDGPRRSRRCRVCSAKLTEREVAPRPPDRHRGLPHGRERARVHRACAA